MYVYDMVILYAPVHTSIMSPLAVHVIVAGPIEDDGSLTLISMASDHQTIHRVQLGFCALADNGRFHIGNTIVIL